MKGDDVQGQAADCLKRGQFEEAIALYTQCIEANPDEVSNYWPLGLAYLLYGDQAEAQNVWFAALMAIPEDEAEAAVAQLVQMLTVAAQQQLEAEQRAFAIQILQQAVELDAEQAEIYYNLGHLLAQQGQLDDAIAAWQQAVTLNPALTEAYEHLADLFQRLEQFDDAIACYTEILHTIPDSLQTFYNLGLCLLHQQRWDEAIACFQRVIQLNPEFVPAYGDEGMALVLQGQLAEGATQLHRAVSLHPVFAERYGAWVDALDDQGSTHANLHHNAVLLQALLNPPSATLFWRLGIVLIDRGMKAGAIACFQLATQLDPSLTEQIEVEIQHLNPIVSTSVERYPVAPSETVGKPNGFYESTWDWVSASGLENSNYWAVYPPSNLHFVEPKTVDKAIDIRFRFGDDMQLPGSFVVDIPNGRYWVNEQHQTAVTTSDNKLLGDVSPDFPILSPGHPDKHPSKHSIFSLDELPNPITIEGKVAILASLFNDAYFHWMFDVLPRIELLKLSEIDLASIDYFLVNHQWPFQQESLERLAIPADRILTPATHPHIQADHLIVPSFPATISWMPQWTCDFLRRVFLKEGAIASSPSNRRFYISRNHTTNRRIINELEITKLIEKFGFQTVILESLSIAEQAKLLATAEAVIAPHGGGLTNLVFCQPGTKVIELFSPTYVYPCYWLVSNLMSLDYYYLLGELPLGTYFNRLLHPNPRTEDMVINPNTLLNLMAIAGIV
jgi:tetratricopeptide (TPR) repeat protein